MENEQLHEFKKILIPLDGSKLSENALRYGVSLADKYNAEIILVSVFSLKDHDNLFKKRIEEMNPQLSEDVKNVPLMYLMENYHGILKSAVDRHEINVKSVLREGNISSDSVLNILIDVVEKEKIDLIVISSHGKSGFKKLKLGSVTDKLITSLSIPVLCVR